MLQRAESGSNCAWQIFVINNSMTKVALACHFKHLNDTLEKYLTQLFHENCPCFQFFKTWIIMS